MTVSCPSCGSEQDRDVLMNIQTGHSEMFYKCPRCNEITRGDLWKTSQTDD